MSKCIDTELGQLLHDYELGLLSDTDKSRFEMHLYDCDYCLRQIGEFMDASKILLKDPDVLKTIKKINDESTLKPEKNKHLQISRYFIAAVLVSMIFISSYFLFIYQGPSDSIQSLTFLPTRTGGNDVLYLDKGGKVKISFYVGDGYKGPAEITISKVNGDTIFTLSSFYDFNEQGFGTITLPVSDLTEGHYMLHIQPTTEINKVDERIYLFKVE